MKLIDESVLEAIADLICGSSGIVGAKGTSYNTYRTMNEIHTFFSRSGVVPRGESGSRKWFVFESLQRVNGKNSFEDILMRLVSPKEYPGRRHVRDHVENRLNEILESEELEASLDGMTPILRESSATRGATNGKTDPDQFAPDFRRLLADDAFADVLSFRWTEAQRCMHAEAYLAAVVMMGSILETVLLYKLELNREAGSKAKHSPKERATGKSKQIHEWSLSNMIDVAHELDWVQGDVTRFSHALRDSRNLVHPDVQRRHRDVPDRDTCAICWQVVQAAVSDLLRTT